MSAKSNATLIVDGGSAWLRDDSPMAHTLWRSLSPTGGETGSWTLDPAFVPAIVWDSMPHVTVQGAICTLQTAAGSWQLPVQVAYAHMTPTPPDGGWFSGSEMQEAWKPLIPVMGQDYSRPGLCALELNVNADGVAHMGTTDGYRIAYWSGQLPVPAGRYAWPADAVRWLAKQRGWGWQAAGADLWAVGEGETWLLRAVPSVGFPDYMPYILASLAEEASCTLYAKPLAQAVKNCTVGKAPKRIVLGWGDSQLRLTGRDSAGATAAAATLAAETEGVATALLDPTLLHPMLVALGRERCTLHVQGANKPLYVTCGSWVMLQMVCRV